MSEKGFFRMKDLLPAAAKGAGLDDAATAGRIWSSWDDIAGEAIAAHATPSSLRKGVLRVHADSPSWATEISYLADELRIRVNRVMGREAVKELRVWTGPNRPMRPSRAGPSRPPDPQGSSVLREASSDPAEALARARAAWAARERQKGR